VTCFLLLVLQARRGARSRGLDLSIGFGGVGLSVEARAMARDASSRTGLSDLALDQQHSTLPAHVWSQAVSANLAAFIALEPVFGQLYQLGAALAFAKALRELAVPVSLDWVRAFAAPVSHTCLRVPTAANEVSWAVSSVEHVAGGTRSRTLRYKFGLTGGVALAAPFAWAEPEEETSDFTAVAGLPEAAEATAQEAPAAVSGSARESATSEVPRQSGISDKAARTLGLVLPSMPSIPAAAAKRLGMPAASATVPAGQASQGVLRTPSGAGGSSSTISSPDPASCVPPTPAPAPAAVEKVVSHFSSWAYAQSKVLIAADSLLSAAAAAVTELDLGSSGKLVADSTGGSAIERGAGVDVWELPCLPVTQVGCAACGQPLLWTASFLERRGVSYCTRAECCAERGRLCAPGEAIADPTGGPSWDARTVSEGSARSVATEDDPIELIGAHPASVPACHGCGEPLWPGEQFLTLNIGSRGRVSYHNRAAGPPSAAVGPAQHTLSPQKRAIAAQTGRSGAHAAPACCMRCEEPGCGKVLVGSASTSGGGGSVSLLGRVAGPSLLCNKHAAIADGFGDSCAGCGAALWHVPAVPPASGGAVAAADADGVLDRLSTLSLGSGERFHEGCFRCSRCAAGISGSYSRSVAQGTASATFVCQGCLTKPKN
jgi:hypothetical protein